MNGLPSSPQQAAWRSSGKTTVVSLMAFSGCYDPGRHGVTCRRRLAHTRLATTVSSAGGGLAFGGRIIDALAAAHDAAVQMIDTSIVRVHQHGACITKNHVRLAGKLLSRLKSGSMLLADRGYDADWIRELAMKKGAWANIPPRNNRRDSICFSPYLYRARNRVERFFNRIKQCRRIATRYDRLAANYLALVQLASIRAAP
jgi:transposase